VKIIIDMNLSPIWVNFLESQGFEAKHWLTVGNPNDPDSVIFAWAQKNNFVIFTNDLDFGAILASSQSRIPSVFQLRTQDLMPVKVGELVIHNLRRFERELNQGALISVNINNAKVRILPIN
jgi:predicted nuclease of predicted toxin-antitoxin system